MTAEQVLVSLGEIDETLTEVCTKTFPKKAIPVKWIGAAAACIAAVLLSTVLIRPLLSTPGKVKDESWTDASAPVIRETVTEYQPSPEDSVDLLDEILATMPAQTNAPSTTVISPRSNATVQNGASAQAAAPSEATSRAAQYVPASTAVSSTSTTSVMNAQQSRDSVAEIAGTRKATSVSSDAWNKAPITSKYPDLTYNGRHYTSRGNSDLRGKVRQSLGAASLQGFDGSPDHKTDAELFLIPGISADAAVAVQFPDGSCCAYVSPQYRPATLGQLMDALSLRENMSFGKVSGCGDGREATIYPAVSDSDVWRMLFDRSAKLDEREIYREETVTIDIRMPLLGYNVGSIGLTADGYLIVPLLESRKVYYIGQERAQEFLAVLDQSRDVTKLADNTTTSGPAEPKGGIETTVQYTKQN